MNSNANAFKISIHSWNIGDHINKGYGKTILFGEHFVVYGYHAIASALADYTVANVEEGEKGLEIIDNRPETPGYKQKKLGERDRALDLMLKYMNIDIEKTPLKITLGGDLLCVSGNGASAAMATAIARALSEHFNLNLNDDEINRIAYEGEKGSAGRPSGIDNTCSTYGGLLIFRKNMEGGENHIEKIRMKQPTEIVLANTGITQDTREIVEDIKLRKENEPDKFQSIFIHYEELFKQAKQALEDYDLKMLGRLMNKNQILLEEMTLSCPEIDKIIETARNAGALGAKLTGTGRGGNVIILAPGDLQEKVFHAINESGFSAVKTKIGI